MLKHGILGLLNYKDMTGYEVMEIFRDSLNFFWTAQTSQIYRELQTIEKNGWASCHIEAQTGKPDKKIYHITEDGRKELISWLGNGQFRGENNSMLLKVFFMGEIDKNISVNFFETIAKSCDNSIESLKQVTGIIDSYKDSLADDEKAMYWKMTAEYGRMISKATKEWSEYCLKLLNRDGAF